LATIHHEKRRRGSRHLSDDTEADWRLLAYAQVEVVVVGAWLIAIVRDLSVM
jgi:hypothetical protein